MDDSELIENFNKLKLKVEQCRRERDDLKKKLHDVICYSPQGDAPTAAEECREQTIETWKEIERRERRYRVTVLGLEAKKQIFDDNLYFAESL